MVEKVKLTEAQARELARMCKRAKGMYEDRHGGKAVSEKLRIMRGGLLDIQEGEKDALNLSVGMKGDVREQIISILEREVDMEKRKINQDWGMDGRKLKACERGIEALKNPETVDKDEI